MKVPIRFLVDSILKDEQEQCVDVIDGFELREEDANAMKESHWAYKPRNVIVHEKRRYEKQAGDVVDEKGFLANGVSAIDMVLDIDVKDVKQNSESEADSGEMIGP